MSYQKDDYSKEALLEPSKGTKRELKANFNRLVELSIHHLKSLKRDAIKNLSKGENARERHLKEISLCIENLECAESIYDDLCVMES